MKDRIIAICLFLLAAATIWAIAAELPKKEYARPSGEFAHTIRDSSFRNAPAVSQEVIRLHILADSDSTQDQSVKLALRDVLLPYLNAATLGASSKTEAMEQLGSQCTALTELANAALRQWGMDYTATISMETRYFPIRIYGTQTYLSKDAVIFPPGYYDTIQVVLGKGEGHNWWCLAYPSLCFIDASYDYIPKDSSLYHQKIGTVEQKALEKLFYGKTVQPLPEETGVKISSTKTEETEVTIYFGSKLWELLKKLLH